MFSVTFCVLIIMALSFFHYLSAMFIPIFSLKVVLYIFLRLCLLYIKTFRPFMSWNVLLSPLLIPDSLDVIVVQIDHHKLLALECITSGFPVFQYIHLESCYSDVSHYMQLDFFLSCSFQYTFFFV